jgi:hypothetical protein
MSSHFGPKTDTPPDQAHRYAVSYHNQPPPHHIRNGSEQTHDRESSHENYFSSSYLPAPSSYQHSEPYARGAEPPPDASRTYAHDAHSYQQTGQSHEHSDYVSSEPDGARATGTAGHSSHEIYLPSSSYLPSSYQHSEPSAPEAEPPNTSRAHGPGADDAHSYYHQQTGHPHEQSYVTTSEPDGAHATGTGHSAHEIYLSSSYLPRSYQHAEPYARGAEQPLVASRAFGPGVHDAHSYQRTGQLHETSAYASSEPGGAVWSQKYGDSRGHLHQATESQNNVYSRVPGSLSSYEQDPAQNYQQRDSVPPGTELHPYSHQVPYTYPETSPRSHEGSGPSQYPPDHFSSSALSQSAYYEHSLNRHHSTEPRHEYILSEGS